MDKDKASRAVLFLTSAAIYIAAAIFIYIPEIYATRFGGIAPALRILEIVFAAVAGWFVCWGLGLLLTGIVMYFLDRWAEKKTVPFKSGAVVLVVCAAVVGILALFA